MLSSDRIRYRYRCFQSHHTHTCQILGIRGRKDLYLYPAQRLYDPRVALLSEALLPFDPQLPQLPESVGQCRWVLKRYKHDLIITIKRLKHLILHIPSAPDGILIVSGECEVVVLDFVS